MWGKSERRGIFSLKPLPRASKKERTIFHIDMNAYFASVAEQANPFLRGKAIGIGGKPGTRGIIAAPSIEAKKRGVKTAMNSYEALRICPDLEIIHGDPSAYEDITNRFLAIFRRYTDMVEVFSIDEAFLDVTSWEERWGGPEALAERVKRDMRRELGEYITCSIGIAPNKMLAKLASDLKKPDGLVRIRSEDVLTVFAFLELTDICGIGRKLERHLEAMGIRTLLDLNAMPLSSLTGRFGPVLGTHLWMIGRGEDPSPVVSIEEAPKSFGNSYTLPEDVRSPKVVREVLMALVEKASHRMRREGFTCRRVDAYLRYHDFSMQGGGLRLGAPTDEPLRLFEAVWESIQNLLPSQGEAGRGYRDSDNHPHPLLGKEGRKSIRMVGVHLGELSPESGQLSFWPMRERRRDLIAAVDKVNERYGRHTLRSGRTMKTVLKRHVSGFKFGTTLERKIRGMV